MKRTQTKGKQAGNTAANVNAANALLENVDPDTGEICTPEHSGEGGEGVTNTLAHLCGKLVLFPIKKADRVPDGPIMRGFIEPKGRPQDKVNVAGWSKIGRESGTEYVSLKAGNNSAEQPDVYSVGPYFGSMFRQIDGEGEHKKVRYFGSIEDSQRTGEDRDGGGIYTTHGRVRFNGKRAVSGDGKTQYITGLILLADMPQADDSLDDDLPF